MTAIAWTALGTLGTEVIAQSSALPEMLSYTNVAIAVSASIAALIALAGQRLEVPALGVSQDQAAMFRSLADEMRFAKTRTRALALAERFEKTERTRTSLTRIPHRSGGQRHALAATPDR